MQSECEAEWPLHLLHQLLPFKHHYPTYITVAISSLCEFDTIYRF